MTDLSTLFDLTDRTAIVTGGSRGLGREIVLGLAEAGADVVIVSRKKENCAELARYVEKIYGRVAIPYGCNVGHWDQIDGLVQDAYERLGRVDVLINNAGMSPIHGKPDTVSEELYDKIMAVNLKGPFRLAALVGERMKAGFGGSIINVSSTAAVLPRPDYMVYSSAKAGLNAMTVALARAYGPTVRVNAVMAGPFLTDVSKAWDMEAFELSAKDLFALQRAGNPHEIVGAILYLASDASSYTSGSILRVDGGSS
jgi:NAD(P)-dependent dehydrogenase (short-subunit alcohol dehydrogenase family)